MELQADSAIKGREEAIKQLRKLQVGDAVLREEGMQVEEEAVPEAWCINAETSGSNLLLSEV